MKKIIVILCVICLMSISSGLSVNIPNKLGLQKELDIDGNILITEARGNRVIEVDSNGNIIWQITGLNYPLDAERLYNGNTLIVVHGDNTIIEVSPAGNIVWQKTNLSLPIDAERLSSGNTLITEFGAGRVIEVDRNGSEVWSKTGFNRPLDAERLPNGNTLIVEPGSGVYSDGRVVEFDSAGNEVWNMTGLDGPVDVERLYNTPYRNTTLITEHTGRNVTEFDENGTIVWQKTGLYMPNDAERVPSDNNLTLISETGSNRTIIINSTTGNIVWVKSGLYFPADGEIVPILPPSLNLKNKVWNPDEQAWVDVLEGVMKGVPVKFKINLTYNGFQGINLMKGMILEDDLPECCLEYIDGSHHITYPNNNNFTNPEIVVSENKKQVIFDWTNAVFNLFVGETIEIEFETDVVEYCYDIVKNFANVDLWNCYSCPEQVHIYNGGSASVNCSQPPSAKILNPKEGYFHFLGRPLFPFLNHTIVYGPINIEVNVTPETEIEKVEFYINDKLSKNDTNPPYEFKWAPILSGPYTIKVIVYDNRGLTASDSIKIIKWRSHPFLILGGFLLIIALLNQR
jgi:hypothetical protein